MPMLRNGTTGDWIGTFAGHKGAVWSAKLDGEGLLAATGAADFSAKIWDAITGKEIHEFGHKHIVKSVEFNHDSSALLTGGHEGLLRVFDLTSNELRCEIAHDSNEKKTINKAIWGKDRNTVLTGASDGTVHVWDLRSNSRTMQLNCSTKLIQDMNITDTTNSSSSILSVAAGSCVSFYNANDYTLLKKHDNLPINFHEEGGVSLHPSGDRYIIGGSDTWVRVYDYHSTSESSNEDRELECHKGHHGPVRCLRYAPNGETYATGSEDGTIRIWQDQVTRIVE
jgi:serine-threonine kinase receptor-associated protein